MHIFGRVRSWLFENFHTDTYYDRSECFCLLPPCEVTICIFYCFHTKHREDASIILKGWRSLRCCLQRAALLSMYLLSVIAVHITLIILYSQSVNPTTSLINEWKMAPSGQLWGPNSLFFPVFVCCGQIWLDRILFLVLSRICLLWLSGYPPDECSQTVFSQECGVLVS